MKQRLYQPEQIASMPIDELRSREKQAQQLAMAASRSRSELHREIRRRIRDAKQQRATDA